MAYTRLTEIDLARAMTVPAGPALDAEMRRHGSPGGGAGYGPSRASLGDLLSASTPLLGSMTPVSWEKLERQIRSKCTADEAHAKRNLLASKSLYDEATRQGWRTVIWNMETLPIGQGENVAFWHDLVVEDHTGPFIPFFDHRLSRGISKSATLQVVYSMQHIGVRERHPDLASVGLAVVRFPGSEDSRSIKVFRHHKLDLLSFEELDARVRSVYESWARVTEDRINSQRRSAGGAR